MATNASPYSLWIIPKDSELGRPLAAFTAEDWADLHALFEQRGLALVSTREPSNPTLFNDVYLDFPRYEFVVRSNSSSELLQL